MDAYVALTNAAAEHGVKQLRQAVGEQAAPDATCESGHARAQAQLKGGAAEASRFGTTQIVADSTRRDAGGPHMRARRLAVRCGRACRMSFWPPPALSVAADAFTPHWQSHTAEGPPLTV